MTKVAEEAQVETAETEAPVAAAPKKAKAAPKKAAKAETAEGEAPAEKQVRRSKFEELYPEDAKLTVDVKENPKRAGTKAHARFEHYRGVDTVGDALANGVLYADIAYDIGRGYITVTK